MKILKLSVHWSPEQAHTALEILDNLREQILEHYDDDIQLMLQEISDPHVNQCQLPFDDPLDF